MRYIIQWSRKADSQKALHLSTFAAEEAETPEAARAQFLINHPEYCVESVKPAGENSFSRYGLGALTEAERQQRHEKIQQIYDRDRAEMDEIREQLLTYTPEEFAADFEYTQRRGREQTQNVEGVHVGDVFYSSWGYDQTNISFYQVVDVRGNHTVIIRPLEAFQKFAGSYNGLTRPVRDHFKGEKQFAVRTRLDSSSSGVVMCDPELTGRHRLYPAEFGKLYSCSTGA